MLIRLIFSNLSVVINLYDTHIRIFSRYCAGVLFFWLLLFVTAPGYGIETQQMKGPKSSLIGTDRAIPDSSVYSSPFQFVLLGSMRFFQDWISPFDGSRCSFTPTCSYFGYEAVHDHGIFHGIAMTADRLMRCNHWTEAGMYYNRMPNGTLHDPVINNLLMQP